MFLIAGIILLLNNGTCASTGHYREQEWYFLPWYPKPSPNSDSLSPESYPVSPRKITTEFQNYFRQFTPFGKPLPPFPQFWLYGRKGEICQRWEVFIVENVFDSRDHTFTRNPTQQYVCKYGALPRTSKILSSLVPKAKSKFWFPFTRIIPCFSLKNYNGISKYF